MLGKVFLKNSATMSIVKLTIFLALFNSSDSLGQENVSYSEEQSTTGQQIYEQRCAS